MDETRLPELAADPESARLNPWCAYSLRAGLLLLPIVAALLGYYRDLGRDSPVWQLHGDQVFYGYQTARAAETSGRWWKIADDRRLGWPYQSLVAKHPGLFEGLDLLGIAALTGHVLTPAQNYHFLVLVVLALNGWIAGALVWRWTGSAFWAALAILAITWNEPTWVRMTGHLNLFKYGWVLLAVWTFARYLDVPSLARGAALGLAVAWLLQGSYYFAYFLVLTLAAWWLGCLVAGTLDRRHFTAVAAAALGFLPAAAAFTFPVWTVTPRFVLADRFSQHPWKDAWSYSAEPWQWLVSRGSARAAQYIAEIGVRPPDHYNEGWSFPGTMVLVGLAVGGIGVLRGWRFCECREGDRGLRVFLGQIALLAGLSVTGGVSFFLFRWVPSMRCYGRAGLMALVGLGSVAAPVCLHALTRQCRFRVTRAAIMIVAGTLIVYDGWHLQQVFRWHHRTIDPTPAWVDWLKDQPPQVKLAAFGPTEGEYWYGTLAAAVDHHHTTLNGGDFALLNADLKLLGASYYQMNQAGLRFIASLGYQSLAIHRRYLEAHPWIEDLEWLERRAERGDWRIFATNQAFQAFPAVSLKSLFEQPPAHAAAATEVPAASWITGQFDLDRTVVTVQPDRVWITWADSAGRPLGTPAVGLFQHVFGPDMPAYTVRTPALAGTYQLLFLDAQRHPLGARLYVVDPRLLTSRMVFGHRPPAFTLSPLTVDGAPGRSDRVRVTVENQSPYYLQAHTVRSEDLGSARVQPGLGAPAPGSLVLELNYQGVDPAPEQVHLLLPRDLPPRGRLTVELPVQWPAPPDHPARLFLMPKLIAVEQHNTGELQGDVALRLESSSAPIAQKPAITPSRVE